MTGMSCSYRFKDMSADHGGVAKELERANEEFKEFERKDIKYREDLKHVKAKLKKLQEKLTKDSAKMEVGLLLDQLKLLVPLLVQCYCQLPWFSCNLIVPVQCSQSLSIIPAAVVLSTCNEARI